MDMMSKAFASGERAINATVCPAVSSVWDVDGSNVWVKHDRAFDTITVHIGRRLVYRRKGARHLCSPRVQRY
jgi:hypothetical protein